MSKSKDKLCGICCKDSYSIRKSFNECKVCACGAPFFSQIVVENNLPSSRRCLIEIPMDFIEDHGHRFDKMDKQVILEGDSGSVYRVKIGGNNFVGFGFEWKQFAQSHNVKSGQIIVFTLVRSSRFLVQINKPSSLSPNVAKPQIPIEVEEICPVKIEPSSPKVDESDDDDIEVSVAQDWLAAKACKSNLTKPALASKVKLEPVVAESSAKQAPEAPERHRVSNPREQQKSGIISKLEADCETFKETCFGQPPVFTTLASEAREAREERRQASSPCSSSENVDVEGSDQSESSDSDSVWTPRNVTLPYVRRRNSNNPRRSLQYETSSDSEIDEEEDEEEVMMNKDDRRGKRLISEGSNSIDSTRGKRARPSDVEAESPRRNDVDRKLGTNPLIYEGFMVTKQAEWHPAGTKRGRTYVSKRRAVTEAERQTTLERARKVHVNNVSFLKQLHKDSCYRALKLFPPAPFYRDHMISNTEGSYKAILEDVNGDRWITRIQGMKMFWKHFTLDHNLEEDDVVVFELIDPRPGSVRFLGHVFRVVDIKKPLIGKKGWALYYNVVEGTKKQYFEERRRQKKKEEAQRVKMLKKQKSSRKDASSRLLNLPD